MTDSNIDTRRSPLSAWDQLTEHQRELAVRISICAENGDAQGVVRFWSLAETQKWKTPAPSGWPPTMATPNASGSLFQSQSLIAWTRGPLPPPQRTALPNAFASSFQSPTPEPKTPAPCAAPRKLAARNA